MCQSQHTLTLASGSMKTLQTTTTNVLFVLMRSSETPRSGPAPAAGQSSISSAPRPGYKTRRKRPRPEHSRHLRPNHTLGDAPPIDVLRQRSPVRITAGVERKPTLHPPAAHLPLTHVDRPAPSPGAHALTLAPWPAMPALVRLAMPWAPNSLVSAERTLPGNFAGRLTIRMVGPARRSAATCCRAVSTCARSPAIPAYAEIAMCWLMPGATVARLRSHWLVTSLMNRSSHTAPRRGHGSRARSAVTSSLKEATIAVNTRAPTRAGRWTNFYPIAPSQPTLFPTARVERRRWRSSLINQDPLARILSHIATSPARSC